MSCKYCGRVKTAIRRWLGIDQIITVQGENFVVYVDQKNALVCDGLEALQMKVMRLTEAGAALEKITTDQEVATGKISHALHNKDQELEERVSALRDMLAANRQEIRKGQDLVRDLDRELTELSVSVKKIEFPDYEPIEYDPEG